MYKQQPVPMTGKVTVRVGQRGPLVASVRVRRTFGASTLTQDIVLRAGSRRLEFVTTVDWRERHKLLKVNFPVTVYNENALHEIQFGHVSRPTHASRPYDATRFEVCNHKWTALTEEGRGVAVLNDSKDGVSVEGNSINLTLLKSALAPDMTADQGLQTFTYAVYAWQGPLADSGVVQEAYDLNVPATVVPGALPGGMLASLFTVSAPGVIVEAVKPAEDGSGGGAALREHAHGHALRPARVAAGPACGADRYARAAHRGAEVGDGRGDTGVPPVRDQDRAAGVALAAGRRLRPRAPVATVPRHEHNRHLSR
jgi:alpha-mannosidase